MNHKLAGRLVSSLPTLPAAALEVIRVCDDPEADIGRLADIVSRDPMLASRVLHIANSAFYSRGGEVTSLQRAAMMLGLRSLRVVALGFSLTQGLPQRGRPAGLDLGVYWHRSVVTAVMARAIAQVVDRSAAEESFVCGLLSDIGKLALSQAEPERYAAAVAAGEGWPSADIERASLGYSASEAAEVLLRQWGVPELVVLGATYADRPAKLSLQVGDQVQELAAIVGLAQLGASILFGDHVGDTLTRFADAGRRLGLEVADVDGVVQRLVGEVEDAAGALSVNLPDGLTNEALLYQARLLLVSFAVDVSVQLEQRSRKVEELERENRELEVRARTDALTGLPNRAALDDFLYQQVHLRLRSALPGYLGLLMIDIDHFGAFNDTYGHQAGDAVLRAVSDALSAVAREGEMLARYGGEEFCLVVPHATPRSLATVAERFRATVEATEVEIGADGRKAVTVSFGAAHLPTVSSPADAERIIAAADSALYRAKEAGRNRGDLAPDLRAALAAG